MKCFWLLSVCVKVNGGANNSAEFHFKGCYRGIKVKKITIVNTNISFEQNNTYLVLLKETSLQGGEIFAELVKYRKVSL